MLEFVINVIADETIDPNGGGIKIAAATATVDAASWAANIE